MPTYVYRCSECHVQYERVQQIADNPDTVCQDCGEEAVRRILQSPALTAAAAPSTKNKVPPPQANPAWERGIAGEHRPGGTFVPYLDSEGKRIGVKKFADNRKKYERILREKKNQPTTT
jgi:putative FmdB family regulatory protein